MLRIGTDGSGVTLLITGCPFCDGYHDTNGKVYSSRSMIYIGSQWWLDKGRDRRDMYAVKIKYCPFCGTELPPLDRWIVKEQEVKA